MPADHSPLPWRTKACEPCDAPGVRILDAKGFLVALVRAGGGPLKVAKANARKIVTALNKRDKKVEALATLARAILDRLARENAEDYYGLDPELTGDIEDWRKQVTAIAGEELEPW